jgi:hypothetical protein
VRWNGQAPVVPELKIPASVVALGGPDFIRGSENTIAASLMAMLRMQMGQAPDPLAAYRAQESAPMVVRHFDRTVAMVEAACKDGDGLSAARLPEPAAGHREHGGRHAREGRHRHAHPQLARAGRERGTRPGERRHRGDAHQLATLQRAARQAVDGAGGREDRGRAPGHRAGPGRRGAGVHGADRRPAAQAGGGGRGRCRPGRRWAARRLLRGGRCRQRERHDTQMPTTTRCSVAGRALQRNASPEGVKPFVLAGLVTLRDTDGTGAMRVHVDPHRDATQLATAGAHTLWWLFAALLVLVNGALFAVRAVQAMRRRTRLHADVAMRPAPGATGVF